MHLGFAGQGPGEERCTERRVEICRGPLPPCQGSSWELIARELPEAEERNTGEKASGKQCGMFTWGWEWCLFQAQTASLVHSTRHSGKKSYQFYLSSSRKLKRTLPNSFCKSCIVLILKPDIYCKERKLKTQNPS